MAARAQADDLRTLADVWTGGTYLPAAVRERFEGPGLPARDAGTTHLCTSDASGNAVALTMTINTPYGSQITAERTGVLLNNEMDDFAIAPDLPNTYGLVDTRGANAIAARKLSSSISTRRVHSACSRPCNC